jgi:hypothetical protein
MILHFNKRILISVFRSINKKYIKGKGNLCSCLWDPIRSVYCACKKKKIESENVFGSNPRQKMNMKFVLIFIVRAGGKKIGLSKKKIPWAWVHSEQATIL